MVIDHRRDRYERLRSTQTHLGVSSDILLRTIHNRSKDTHLRQWIRSGNDLVDLDEIAWGTLLHLLVELETTMGSWLSDTERLLLDRHGVEFYENNGAIVYLKWGTPILSSINEEGQMQLDFFYPVQSYTREMLEASLAILSVCEGVRNRAGDGNYKGR